MSIAEIIAEIIRTIAKRPAEMRKKRLLRCSQESVHGHVRDLLGEQAA
jgi:hypothetical protein